MPKSGTVPVVTMIVRLGEREEITRILLDTGSTVPLLSQSCAKTKRIPVAKRPTARPIQDYAGQEVEGAGLFYTAHLILQHRYHFSRVSFEVVPLASDYDAILPRWWLAKEQCIQLASTGHIMFTSAECQRRYTEGRQLHFSETTPQTPAAVKEGELQAAIDRVPKEYVEYIPIMTTEASLLLPQHLSYDHAIDFKDNTIPPWGPVYPLNETELEELRKWLSKITTMVAVRESKSACSSPILFVHKGHGRGLYLCIDYRAINKITVPNHYPLPNIDELKERVRGAKYFKKNDLKNSYHLIRIKEGEEWKTAFHC